MNHVSWHYKSLPDLGQVVINKTFFAIEEKNEKLKEKIENIKNVNHHHHHQANANLENCESKRIVLKVPRRSYSLIFSKKMSNSSKMPIIYDEKTLELGSEAMKINKENNLNDNKKNNDNNKNNNKVKYNAKLSEEEYDSGLCSAAEDSIEQTLPKKSVCWANETVSNSEFQTELQTKAREIREKLKRRQTSKFNRFKTSIAKKSPRFGRTDTNDSNENEDVDEDRFEYGDSDLTNANDMTQANIPTITMFTVSEVSEDDRDTIKLENEEKEPNLSTISLNGLNGGKLNTVESTINIINTLENALNKSALGHLGSSSATVAAIAAAAAATTSENDNGALQKFIDIVIPPLISSNFNLNKTDDVAELSIIMQQQFSEAVSNTNFDFSNLNGRQKDIEANEQIMRTCLNYLDLINKKHTRQRQLQNIRNKISGIVLVTIVFFMIIGLGLIMSIYLVNSFTKIIYSNRNAIQANDIIFSSNETTTINTSTFAYINTNYPT